MSQQQAKQLFDFIDNSSLYAAMSMTTKLEKNGYQRLEERDAWKLEAGGRYYVGNGDPIKHGFRIIGAHTDSPGVMSNEVKIERIGFGIVADEDKSAHIFAHADRFLVIDLKNRKEVTLREYRPNPSAEICKQKYPKPSVIGDNPSEEEVEIYRKMAEILKDCKTIWGRNFGNYVYNALSAVGANPILSDRDPQETIDSLIGARYLAGYRD